MASDTLIRDATAEDVEPLAELSRRTISTCYRPFLGDEGVDAFISGDGIETYISGAVDRCLVIQHEDRAVGYAVCDENLIDLMMIDQELHGQGFGTTLLQRVEIMLFETYDELTLESFEGNEQANKFYAANDWRETDQYFDKDSGVNKIVFMKSMRPA